MYRENSSVGRADYGQHCNWTRQCRSRNNLAMALLKQGIHNGPGSWGIDRAFGDSFRESIADTSCLIDAGVHSGLALLRSRSRTSPR
jgi:hypothetical protein